MSWPTTPDGKYLVLRTVSQDWTSHGGFRWQPVGVETVAPDWDPAPGRACGGGLHGLLWGCGDAYLLGSADDVWLVVAVDPADVANPDAPNKVRFRAGTPVMAGTRDEAVAWIVEHGGYGLPVVYARVTAGDGGTATAGYRGTATAGNEGTATAGNEGTATAGNRGTATAGDGGTATAGNEGTATAGYRGTATAGDGGTATAGDNGTVVVRWWDGSRYRLAVGHVGEDGIEAGVAYRCDKQGRLVAVAS